MLKQGFIAALFLMQTSFANHCQKFKYANFSTSTCEECHPLCNSGWCKGPSLSDCLVCANSKQYRDFQSWQCLDSCYIVQKQNVEVYTNLISGDGIFQYCLETEFYIDSYDQNNNLQPSLELGTKLLPFRSLDDAFRTIFNYNYNNESQIIINIKHGANLTVHSEEMPLIVLNSNVELRPYSDDIYINKKTNLTQILIYHEGYDRPQMMNGFNPSFSDVNQIIDYNMTDKVSKGLVDADSINAQKFKFVVLNSNFKIQEVNFTEITSKQDETNTLFRMYYGEYKTLILEYCHFNLNWLLAMTQDGVNLRLLNSFINIENTVNVFRFGAKNICSLYDKYQIANNFLIDHCIFKGLSPLGQEAYNFLFVSMYPANLTVTNTQFLNIQWVSSSSEHFSFKCPSPVYTKYLFENNTYQNTDESRISHLAFQMILNEENIQEAYFINNKFINIQYVSPGMFRGTKPGGKGFKVFFMNNYFEKIINVREAQTAISFEAEEITINNITIKDSVIAKFAQLQNKRSVISNINFVNVSRMDKSLAPSLSHAFLTWTLSQDSIISSINFHNCDFSLSRAINIMQSSNITIENLHIINSQANDNNLIHISLSKDLNFENIIIHNIKKNSPGMVALFNVFQLQSWGQNNKIMKYNVQNLNFSQSSISVLNIETYQPLELESSIIINFQNITIQNINIKAKEALFQFNPTNQSKLSFYLDESVISNNSLELGYMIDLRQNSNKISITNTYFFNNSGKIMKTQSYEVNDENQSLTVSISQSRFFKNWANQSLFHISANSLLAIQNSTFEENFSLGRGSIIFSELPLSRVSISQSIFKKNYALTGGVLFTTLNGFIEVEQSSFIENFALAGGVYYTQNEGHALMKNSNFTLNLALKGSLIYAINCFNPITISGGLISRNGFQYHPNFKNPEIFNLKQDSMGPALDQYFDQIYIKKIAQIFSTDNNLFMKYLQENERSHQISMVKAFVKLSGEVLITEQDLLLIAQSQSTIEMRQATYQNSENKKETIFIEQSNLILSNVTIQNISSSAPIFQIESDSIVISSQLIFQDCHSSLLRISQSKCSFDKFKAEAISLNTNEGQKQKQIISMLYSEVNFTNTILQNINNLTNIGSDSEHIDDSKNTQDKKREKIVLYAKKSFLKFFNLNATEFNGQLIFLESASQLNFTFSSISNGNLNNDQGYSTVITLLDSSAIIGSSSFNDILGLSGSVLYAQNQRLQYSKALILVQNSTFRRIYSTQEDGGGSIQITNSDASLAHNRFIQNLAFLGSGGALRLLCSVQNSKKCNFNVEQNLFEDNSAFYSGGAIYYNLYSPNGLANNTFNHNLANYGTSIGSYAFRLKIIANSDIDILKLNSGEITQEVLNIGIYDQQGQLVSNDFTSEAVLYTKDFDNLQIVGNSKVIASSGIYVFKNIKYLARPNYNTSIIVSSNVINKTACYQVTGSQCDDLQLKVNFRACKMGEVLINNVCEPCAKGYYSFNTDDKFCLKCIQNLMCNGKNITMVNPGFWRSSPTSLEIYQCPKQDSCEGGIDSKCKLGYKGRMCNECNSNAPDGKIYGKSGAYSCQVCPNIGVQFIQTLGVIAVISVYIIILLNSVLQNPKRNKPQTVLIRILTNYLQAIMIVKEFDLTWPKQVNDMLKIFSVVSYSQEMVISLDCYINNSYLEKQIHFLPTFYLKVLLFGISPIIFGFLSSIVWMAIKVLMKKIKNRNIDVKLNIQATCFIIFFISYPTITTLTFSLFECFQIDNDKYYLRKDFSIQCWTEQHIKMSLSIGLTFIIVWVIGFPSFIMYKLYKNKKNFNNVDFLSRYGLFFIGLNNDSYFWEVTIQNGRKILFILFNQFLSVSQSKIKAQLGILTLFIQALILARLNPFIDPRFNQVDIQAQYAAIYTLFCGMFFVEEQVQKNNDAILVLFILVFGYNIFFLSLWLFRFASVLLRINIDKLRQYSICRWLKHVKMLSYEEDLNLYVDKQKLKSSCSLRRQIEIKDQRALKYVMPATNQLAINHNDLLKLPKTSFRKRAIKKGENKKKRIQEKGQIAQVVKGISPQFPMKNGNVDIMSNIIQDEKSQGQLPFEVSQSQSQELKKIYDRPFPFL